MIQTDLRENTVAMIAFNRLLLIALLIAFLGWKSSVHAEDDVTVISASTTTPAPARTTVASDGTPVVHKSLHKKKHAASATAQLPVAAPTNTVVVKNLSTVTSQPSVTKPSESGNSSPTVETGLPVAHYSGASTSIKGVSTYIPTAVPLPAGKTVPGKTPHKSGLSRTVLSSVVPMTSSAAGSFSTPSRDARPSPDFVFTNFPRKIKNSYPWRTNIVTTEFWIGEGATPISSTTNEASAWDLDWRLTNSGADSPNDRNGYASARHAATVNPFYVALPFNDLAFPEKAREWLPRGWYRHPKDGKQVSACKDRWVEIKNAQGDICYAQWEDVGPLRYDHAEYVFGGARPTGLGDDHAGLDVSPAVADYLNITDRNRFTSWRFVDDEDVRPGAWLKLDEQAVIYTALHQLKNSSPADLPIQRATEPMDDPANIDSNKKKVDASKG